MGQGREADGKRHEADYRLRNIIKVIETINMVTIIDRTWLMPVFNVFSIEDCLSSKTN
jgi:hypothetical protein